MTSADEPEELVGRFAAQTGVEATVIKDQKIGQRHAAEGLAIGGVRPRGVKRLEDLREGAIVDGEAPLAGGVADGLCDRSLPMEGFPTRMTLRCSSMKRPVRSSFTTLAES